MIGNDTLLLAAPPAQTSYIQKVCRISPSHVDFGISAESNLCVHRAAVAGAAIDSQQQLLKMSLITATAWVPRGFAAQFPKKHDFDEAEVERIADLAKLQLDDAKQDLDEARNGVKLSEDPEENECKEKNGVLASKSKGCVRQQAEYYGL